MNKQIRLSYSTLELLNTCERKFELEKLRQAEREPSSPHLIGGTAFGVGVASFLATQNRDKALLDCWLAYYPKLEIMEKNQATYLNALEASFPKLEEILMDYKVLEHKGKPATELSFRLNIDETFYFVGYIDAVLVNRLSGKAGVFECKHTGLKLTNLEPLYKNSGQALGYSIILDSIMGEEQAEYDVTYFSAQLQQGMQVTPHLMVFPKTLLDRLNWFVSLKLDVERIHRMMEVGIFPQRGSSCLKFNKPCFHFGLCNLSSIKEDIIYVEDDKEYDFEFDLDTLIENHIARITKTNP